MNQSDSQSNQFPPASQASVIDNATSVKDCHATLALLTEPGSRFEIRVLPQGKYQRFDATPEGLQEAAEYAARWSDNLSTKGVYVTLNPIGTEPEKAATDACISRRRWLPLDVDPVRPDDTNATKGEYSAALHVFVGAEMCLNWLLHAMGKGINANSGNGRHKLYPIDLPNDNASRDLVKDILEGVARYCNRAYAKVDTKLFNASRIIKLYGTWTRKGPHSEDRPHRKSSINKHFHILDPISFDQLEYARDCLWGRINNESFQIILAAVSQGKQIAQPALDGPRLPEATIIDATFTTATPEPLRDPQNNGQDSHWKIHPGGRPDALTRARAYLATCEPAIQGKDGSGRCFKAVSKVGPGFNLPYDVAFKLLWEEYNPRCVPPWSEKELRHKLDDAYKDPKNQPYGFLLNEERPTDSGGKTKGKTKDKPEEDREPTDYSKLTDKELGIVPLIDVVEEQIRWLWPYRLEVGGLALMAGDAGIGKSQVLLKTAAIVSTGGNWPGGEGQAPKGNVVIVSAEDRPSRTIKPRLLAMGANINKITILKAKVVIEQKNKDGSTTNLISFMTFQDRAYWAEVFDRIGSVVLFIADPLPSYLGRGVNDSRNMEIRAVLEPFLDEVIWPRDICMWGNAHLNKQIDHKTPLHRVSGSVAYGALPRNVHFIVRDEENPLRRYFKQAKCNDAPDDLHALPFRIEERAVVRDDGEVIKTAVPVFEEEGVKIDLTETMNPKRGRPADTEKKQQCAEWLKQLLTEKPLPSPLIEQKAIDAGFSRRTLWAVKDQVCGKAIKDAFSGGWYWKLKDPA